MVGQFCRHAGEREIGTLAKRGEVSGMEQAPLTREEVVVHDLPRQGVRKGIPLTGGVEQMGLHGLPKARAKGYAVAGNHGLQQLVWHRGPPGGGGPDGRLPRV